MMPGPGGAIRREAKRVQGRLIWVLVLGTLLEAGDRVQGPGLAPNDKIV